MRHRVIMLGAGYAGLPAAKRLAHQVRADEVEVTVVNASPYFLERPRLHQASTGQPVRRLDLRTFLAPAGVRLVVGAATGLDLDGRTMTVDTATGTETLAYDTLVYGAGSTIDVDAVPGITEHAHAFTGREAAARLHAHATEVAERGGELVVCGGGLTGIEAATELAESFPALRVTLVSARRPGAWLSARARAHLDKAFGRLGITVREARVAEVRSGELLLADGGTVAFDCCVWAGGFTVPPLAREAGLRVNAAGRVLVDETLRSVSHGEVYAIGDATAASGPWGECVAMGCRSGGFTGPYLADALAARLAGETPKPFTFRYLHECVSLGRRDAVIQLLHADESPKRLVLTGRTAVRYKEIVLRSATWLFRFPGPYLPRRRRLAATAG